MDSARIAAHAAAGLTGFEGDTPAERLAGYALFVDIAADELDLDAGTTPLSHIDTTGSTAIEAMRKVEATDNGVLFDGRDGHLVFHGRARRYTAESAFTLNCEWQHVEASLEVKDDDQFQVNDATATNGTFTARVLDQDSVDEHGRYAAQLEVHSTSIGEVEAAAQWRVGQYADPEPRFTNVEVDLLALINAPFGVETFGYGIFPSGLAADVLTADIGTRFTVENLPDQAPDATVDMFVEGYTETIGSASHRISFNTSPASVAEVWIIGHPVYGRLGLYPLAY